MRARREAGRKRGAPRRHFNGRYKIMMRGSLASTRRSANLSKGCPALRLAAGNHLERQVRARGQDDRRGRRQEVFLRYHQCHPHRHLYRHLSLHFRRRYHRHCRRRCRRCRQRRRHRVSIKRLDLFLPAPPGGAEEDVGARQLRVREATGMWTSRKRTFLPRSRSLIKLYYSRFTRSE